MYLNGDDASIAYLDSCYVFPKHAFDVDGKWLPPYARQRIDELLRFFNDAEFRLSLFSAAENLPCEQKRKEEDPAA